MMYHVVGSDWQQGEDLLSFDEQEARGYEPTLMWDGDCDTDVICLFASIGEAREFRDEFRSGCHILAVDVTDLYLVTVAEGYKAAQRLIAAQRLEIVE